MNIFHDPEGTDKSVLLVNRMGRIKRLHVPFRVICIEDTRGIRCNVQVYVDGVVGTVEGELYYIIFSRAYLHSHFQIILQF